MRITAILILVLFTVAGCKKDNTEVETSSKFRIQNNTSFVIESAVVKMGSSENSFSSISPGQVSDYKSFSESNYPNIKLSINGSNVEFNIQPIDATTAESTKSARPVTAVVTYSEFTKAFDVHFTVAAPEVQP